jgi:hypothetical protein
MNYDTQRNAIAQAMMNIQNPPPRTAGPQMQRPPMTASMVPQGPQAGLPAPLTPQAPQMGGSDFPGRPPMQQPQQPMAAPPPGVPMSLAPPQPDMSQAPPMPTDTAQYPPM